jgi:hypothetical protein
VAVHERTIRASNNAEPPLEIPTWRWMPCTRSRSRHQVGHSWVHTGFAQPAITTPRPSRRCEPSWRTLLGPTRGNERASPGTRPTPTSRRRSRPKPYMRPDHVEIRSGLASLLRITRDSAYPEDHGVLPAHRQGDRRVEPELLVQAPVATGAATGRAASTGCSGTASCWTCSCLTVPVATEAAELAGPTSNLSRPARTGQHRTMARWERGRIGP